MYKKRVNTMNSHVLKTLTISSLVICAFVSDMAFSQSQSTTISDKQIPYLAMGKGNSERSMIVTNPDLCQEVPGPCRFFITHVQAHRQSNHLILPPNAYPPATEAKADCFAAKNSDAQDVLDTYELLMQQDKAEKYSILGDLKARSQNIKTCAIKAKNWIGDN